MILILIFIIEKLKLKTSVKLVKIVLDSKWSELCLNFTNFQVVELLE